MIQVGDSVLVRCSEPGMWREATIVKDYGNDDPRGSGYYKVKMSVNVISLFYQDYFADVECSDMIINFTRG